jgi:hypothetical protein
LVSNLGREFVCFESRDAVDGIHLEDPSVLDIACPLFDARLMDGAWIGDLAWWQNQSRALPERDSAGAVEDIAVLRALLARGWNGGN